VFVALTWLILRIRRRLFMLATRLITARTEAVRVAGAPLLQSASLRNFVRVAVHSVVWLILAILCYEWLAFVLTQFPYTRAWGEALGGYLLGIVQQLGGAALHAIPDLIVAVLIFLIARAVIKALRPVFDRIERGHGDSTWLERDTVVPTRRLVNVGVWLFAVVMAYPYIPGADSEAFKGISVLVGLMITLGGSSLFGQAASGLILIYSRTLRVGEYVRVAEQEGTVTEMGTFTTRIRTGMGEEVTIPNAVVLGTTTKNYSRAVKGTGYVVDTVVTVGYDTPWRQVEALLIEAALRTPGVLGDPAPRVFQMALSDFYVEYRLVCQAIPSEPRPRAEVLAALHTHVLDVFNEYGVQIMSPHYLGDPTTPKVVPPDQRFAAPAKEPPA
jgi:small-conductance mechanosensitive channel